MTDDCSIADPRNVSVAMKIFYLRWMETFGDSGGRVKMNLDTLLLMWGSESKSVHAAYDETGRYQKNVPVSGVAHSKGTIWVRKQPMQKLCDTSLVHELVHVSIWTLKGTDGDPDHLGREYYGWTVNHSAFIQNLNIELCLLGI
jgi:hypothetical protein